MIDHIRYPTSRIVLKTGHCMLAYVVSGVQCRITTSAARNRAGDPCKVILNLEKHTVAPLATQPSPLVRYYEWRVSEATSGKTRPMDPLGKASEDDLLQNVLRLGSLPALSRMSGLPRKADIRRTRRMSAKCRYCCKVEIGTTLKISRKLICGPFCCCRRFSALQGVRGRFWMKRCGPSRRCA